MVVSIFLIILYYYYVSKNILYSIDLTVHFYKWCFIILKSYLLNFFNVVFHHFILLGLVIIDIGIFNFYRYYLFSILLVFIILAPFDINSVAWNNTGYLGHEDTVA